MFLDELKKRRTRVNNLIKKLENSKGVRSRITGRIECRAQNGYMRYTLVSDDSTEKHYLQKSELDIAGKIIQRDYDNAVLKAAKNQSKAYDAFIKCLEENDLEAKYTALSTARRAFVNPYVVPFEEYAEKWRAAPYNKLPFKEGDGDYINANGERMRSKSECLISNLLIELKIPYKYDYQLKLKNGETVYIDFVVLDRTTREEKYIEHFGVMSDPDYVRKTMKKLENYPHIGLILGHNFFFTFETEPNKIDFASIKQMLTKNLLDQDV